MPIWTHGSYLEHLVANWRFGHVCALRTGDHSRSVIRSMSFLKGCPRFDRRRSTSIHSCCSRRMRRRQPSRQDTVSRESGRLLVATGAGGGDPPQRPSAKARPEMSKSVAPRRPLPPGRQANGSRSSLRRETLVIAYVQIEAAACRTSPVAHSKLDCKGRWVA